MPSVVPPFEVVEPSSPTEVFETEPPAPTDIYPTEEEEPYGSDVVRPSSPGQLLEPEASPPEDVLEPARLPTWPLWGGTPFALRGRAGYPVMNQLWRGW
jgi:hypothetical protein